MATTKLNRKVIIQLHVLKKRENAPYLKENTLEHTVQGTVFTLVLIELSIHLLSYPLIISLATGLALAMLEAIS